MDNNETPSGAHHMAVEESAIRKTTPVAVSAGVLAGGLIVVIGFIGNKAIQNEQKDAVQDVHIMQIKEAVEEIKDHVIRNPQ